MKPTLFVLAAGMGSRYGGLKQLDGLGPHGETIMDYSIYDAIHSGFGKVVFVIRRDFEQEFRDKILSKYESKIPTEVVFQSIDDLPEGFTCPEDRTKPWGTNHAVLMGKDVIKEPFAVINSDDFYGRNSFNVGNTMSESGTVSRGVCETENGLLKSVVERTKIGYDDNHDIIFTEGDLVEKLEPTTPVSMNFWGFTPDYFEHSEKSFINFLNHSINVPKSEFFIPIVVSELVESGQSTVEVLRTDSKWFGVTYSEDRPAVVEKFAELHRQGIYPDKMF